MRRIRRSSYGDRMRTRRRRRIHCSGRRLWAGISSRDRSWPIENAEGSIRHLRTPGYGKLVLCTRGRSCCSKPHVQKIPATILYYLLKAINEAAAAAESLKAMVNARLYDLEFAVLDRTPLLHSCRLKQSASHPEDLRPPLLSRLSTSRS